MKDRVHGIPQDLFVHVWNSAATLADAATRVSELAGKRVPSWAVMARASVLRKAGVEMQRLFPPPPRVKG